ncbi:MAG: tetraacyldisaccharide 4'-kinase [Polaromonas sp.]|nr:tetraacyldisaccharide 4'-kinase [Polaromonas sp.]
MLPEFFQATWAERTWAARLLWPMAQLYRGLLVARSCAYRCHLIPSRRFAVPVVVIGNVVVGGAGKTPLVISMVRHLQARGLNVGVVSRGYGRNMRQSLEVLATTPVQHSGDEPALIKRATGAPVFVARRRADAVGMLLERHPGIQVVITDDGLQHTALQRDIEVVVFDDRGVGNGWLLPAGPLREPWPRPAMKARQILLHTGMVAAFSGFTSTRRLALHGVAGDGSRVSLADLRHTPITAMAGIANPDGFFSMLRARGLAFAATVELPDHDDFESLDLRGYAGSTVLCTEKDAVKLFAKPTPANCKLLAVPLIFEPEPAFYTAFDSLLAEFLSPLPSNHGHQTS